MPTEFTPYMPRDLVLVRGKRYRLIYQRQGLRTPRLSVLDFMNGSRYDYKTSREIQVSDPFVADELFFNARPAMGTQSFSTRWTQFLSVTEVPKDTPICIEEKVPAGERLMLQTTGAGPIVVPVSA